MKNSVVVTVKGVSKSFKSRGNKHPITGIWRPEWSIVTAVNDISFKVRKGESVAFLGPNGAGKTTTTKMLSGIVYPSSGQISVLGYTPQERKEDFLCRIGLVMGNRAGLNWDLTARQSYALLGYVYQIERSQLETRVTELSRMLQVEHRLDTQVRRTSLGERMKLELIGALLHQPEVLFLDEPTIGLDIDAKSQIRLFLRELQQSMGTTIMLTSHDMDDVARVCDRVLVIAKGQIVHDGSLAELEDTYHKDRYIRLHFSGTAPSVEQLQQWGHVLRDQNGVLLQVPKAQLKARLGEILAHDSVADIGIESAPLETIIADIFKSSRSE